jgi:hypothetical protein
MFRRHNSLAGVANVLFVLVMSVGVLMASVGHTIFDDRGGSVESANLNRGEMESIVAGSGCTHTMAVSIECVLPGGTLCGMGSTCVQSSHPGHNPWRCYRVATLPTFDCTSVPQ